MESHADAEPVEILWWFSHTGHNVRKDSKWENHVSRHITRLCISAGPATGQTLHKYNIEQSCSNKIFLHKHDFNFQDIGP